MSALGLALGAPFVAPLACLGSAIAELYRQGEPGATFIAQKPSDLYARRNGLLVTEQFDSATWTKDNSTVLANQALAPDGTVTMDKLRASANTNPHQVYQTLDSKFAPPNTTVTWSVYVKAAEWSWAFVSIFNGGTDVGRAKFNLSTGAADGTFTTGLGTGRIEAAANGCYRISVTAPLTTGTWRCYVRADNGAGDSFAWLGDGSSGIYVWGGQWEVASTASAYQRITDWTTEFLYAGRDFTRRNLLTGTAGFTTGWTQTECTAPSTLAVTDPFGGNNARKLTESSANATHTVTFSTTALADSTTYTGTIYARAAERSWIVLTLRDKANSNKGIYINLANGATGAAPSGGYTTTYSATSMGDGWYRILITQSAATGGTTPVFGVTVASADGTSLYQGDGSSGIYVYGPQLEQGSIASDYQAVTDGSEFIPVVNPLITQWTDNLGTTPNVALEETIGLQQDVRPIFYGPNLTTANATAKVGSPGVVSAVTATGFTVTGGAGADTNTYMDITTVPGRTYRITAYCPDLLDLGIVDARSAAAGAGVSLGLEAFSSADGGTGQLTPLIFTATGTTSSLLVTAFGPDYTVSQVRVSEVISSPNVVGQPLLGSELNTNPGPFTASTGWTATGAVTYAASGGELRSTGNSVIVGTPTFTVALLRTYRIVVSFRITTSIGDLTVNDAGFGTARASIALNLGPGTYTKVLYYTPVVAGSQHINFDTRFDGSTATDVTWLGVSIKEVYGNHRTQATSTARARITAKYNKLLATQELANASWTKTDTTATDGTVAGPGTTALTATTVAEGSAGTAVVYQDVGGFVAGSSVTGRWVLKAGNHDWVSLGLIDVVDNLSFCRGYFNITTGQVGTIDTSGGGSAAAGSITALGGGWYLCTLSGIPKATCTSVRFQSRSASADASGTRVNNGVRYQCGADLRLSCYAHSGLPAYQRVWDSTTGYDDTGFPARISYLGDDGYATGSVDFSASDGLQMWAAVAKLSDAAGAIFMELGNITTTAGCAYLSAPDGATATFGAAARGDTVFGAGQVATAPGNASPKLAVVSSTSDISDDTTTLRVNGVAATSASGDKGAGNFANAAINCGARNNAASAFLTGDEFISIVRGGATPSAAVINAVERECGSYARLSY